MFMVLSVAHLRDAACALVPQVNPSRADRWTVPGRKCPANSNHEDFGRTSSDQEGGNMAAALSKQHTLS